MMKMKDDDFGSFIAMVVKDADVMLGFYKEILGMELWKTDDSDKGVTKYYLTFKGGMLKMFAPDKPPKPKAPGFMETTGYKLQAYRVINMTELFKKFEDKGVQVKSTPQPTGTPGSTWGVILDPEGNGIEFTGTG